MPQRLEDCVTSPAQVTIGAAVTMTALRERHLRVAGRSVAPYAYGNGLRPLPRIAQGSMKRLNDARILMYSHDTFGLGHLRRCRTIAHDLVERYKGLTVLIISGSQIAGAFDFKARVDFVKIPSVIKLYSGDYTSISEHIDIGETLRMREALIAETALRFDPDIFIVDKEPMGLRGEVENTLRALRKSGCHTVLGLRDVMDAPELLEEEWSRKDTMDKIASLYEEVWVYGPEDFWDPLQGLDVPAAIRGKTHHTGFLTRELPDNPPQRSENLPKEYILVTAGGGGDGDAVMSMVLAAREHDRTLDFPLLIVTGPFMKQEQRETLERRAAALANVTIITFDKALETLIDGATAMIGMCGYNTFCEILSFDTPALFLPRTHPREEQLIRATRADELGLTRMLDADQAADPVRMAAVLRTLPDTAPPSKSDWQPDMQGLENVAARVETLLKRSAPAQSHLSLAAVSRAD